jgi:reductive dehalogenase
MLFKTAGDDRPYHLGPYPLETLPHAGDEPAAGPMANGPSDSPAPEGPLAAAARMYRDLFARYAVDDPVEQRAPVPDDVARRAMDIKGYGYFMNADQVGIGRLPQDVWTNGDAMPGHEFGVVVLVAHGRLPEADNPARGWVAPALGEVADMRAAEIAVCIARHIRVMGFEATAHVAGASALDVDRAAVLAGLCVADGARLRNPFIDGGFSLAVVSTAYALETDRPLARAALDGRGLRYWLGLNGATSGREWNRQAKRATHMSKYPMEQVTRVERPTTLILDEEVPRVAKRAAFFERALRGDLGSKAQKERNRFAFKQPHTHGMLGAMRDMVPLQGGDPDADADTSLYGDAAANARALKSLSYLLGSDLTGVCEIPPYAWFSHDSAGEEIVPYHRYAVVMLIDQEYDTMEAASGDDWISGAQSMRAYLRGGEIAGIMAETLRRLGFPARAQTNVDSDLLHIPLVLWAGLGEMSRIGELVLNPFVGPRFKSVVLTTDMPLEPDRPIDFGLQYFCSNCTKCARECPCDAIPLGPKIMFNGYETWKPDVERCARYRLTNQKGSACGRCMKTCPLNKVVTADGPLVERLASWCGINARWLKPVLVPIAVKMDDWLGHGRRNLVKKWWLDFELVDGVCVEPVKGTNERDLDLDRNVDPAKQKMAIYHADMMPVPNDAAPSPVDRKAAVVAGELIETPDEARSRVARGGPVPAHYIATPPAPGGPRGPAAGPSVYGLAKGSDKGQQQS